MVMLLPQKLKLAAALLLCIPLILLPRVDLQSFHPILYSSRNEHILEFHDMFRQSLLPPARSHLREYGSSWVKPKNCLTRTVESEICTHVVGCDLSVMPC